MCLQLNDDHNVKIATEDIVCYKYALHDYRFDDAEEMLNGKSFRGTIRGKHCEGIIAIDDGRLFLCHNNRLFDGLYTANKYGMLFSWVLDYETVLTEVDGKPFVLPHYRILKTPYRSVLVKIGETYNSKLRKRRSSNGYYIIEDGLHSFKNLKDCLRDGGKNSDSMVIECVIPKGSKYYEGSFNGPGYASDTITYVKEISK